MATVTELQSELTTYKTARDNILQLGQDNSMSDGRQLTRADLKWIDTRISQLEHRISIAKNDGKVPSYQVLFPGR